MDKVQMVTYKNHFQEIVSNLVSNGVLIVLSQDDTNYIIQGKRGKKLTLKICLQLNIFGEADIYFLIDGHGIYDEGSIKDILPKKKSTRTIKVA